MNGMSSPLGKQNHTITADTSGTHGILTSGFSIEEIRAEIDGAEHATALIPFLYRLGSPSSALEWRGDAQDFFTSYCGDAKRHIENTPPTHWPLKKGRRNPAKLAAKKSRISGTSPKICDKICT